MKKFYFLISLIFFLSVACASTSDNLKRETARYLGDIHPDKVEISDVERGVMSVKWKADTPKGKYDCSADDMVRRVHCVKE
jgi:hypothetical protein